MSITNTKEQEREASIKFNLIDTSNVVNTYLTKIKRLRMVVYEVSGIISKNRNVSDGKLLPLCNVFTILHCLLNLRIAKSAAQWHH